MVQRVGCIGSYARGDWGVGSDLDVVVILRESTRSQRERYAHYYPDGLPVPADLWVYTQAEWELLNSRSPQLGQRIQGEWIGL
jgi:predicted nucleotidyltransferase